MSGAIAEAFRELKARVVALEARTANFKYVGVFKQGNAYAAGNFCTHDGSVWHANRDTIEQPGTSSGAWTLAVKKGRSDRR